MKKILFVILDGISDGLIEKKTSLEMAEKPNLDFIAKNGFAGLIENKLGNHPDSGISTFVLFGYEQQDYPGRGYLDALGTGLNPKLDDVCIRADFATVKETVEDPMKTGDYEPRLLVVDRRAGRDKTDLAEMSKLLTLTIDGMKINFYKSVAHRGVLLISSIEASPAVSDSDPMKEGKEVLPIKPLANDNASVKTAAILNKYERETYKILKNHPANKYRAIPANFLLLRGASKYRKNKTFKEKFNLSSACIAASPAVKGLARACETNVIEVSGTTADLNTNLSGKALAALEALKRNDFVLLHILGCDIAGHDKKVPVKQHFIEKIDREVIRRILEYADFDKMLLVITSDHVTSCYSGEHEAGFLPFVIFGKGVKPNSVEKFDEKSCKLGPLVDITDFMEELLRFS